MRPTATSAAITGATATVAPTAEPQSSEKNRGAKSGRSTRNYTETHGRANSSDTRIYTLNEKWTRTTKRMAAGRNETWEQNMECGTEKLERCMEATRINKAGKRK